MFIFYHIANWIILFRNYADLPLSGTSSTSRRFLCPAIRWLFCTHDGFIESRCHYVRRLTAECTHRAYYDPRLSAQIP